MSNYQRRGRQGRQRRLNKADRERRAARNQRRGRDSKARAMAGAKKGVNVEDQRQEVLDAVKEFIDTNYMVDNLSLDHFVTHKAIKRRTVQRALKENKTNWRVLLKERRMIEAANLLRDSEMSIGAVGMEVGYHQPHQFAKQFKKYYGLTPSEYRERIDDNG